jgi:hypothetical protein
VLCRRVYNEHLVPQLGLRASFLPPELHSFEAFCDHLCSNGRSHIAVKDESGEFVAHLASVDDFAPSHAAQAIASTNPSDRAPHALDPRLQNESHEHIFPSMAPGVAADSWLPAPSYPVGDHQNHGDVALPPERVSDVRQTLCRALLDYVLSEVEAVDARSAVSVEDARALCSQCLVRLPIDRCRQCQSHFSVMHCYRRITWWCLVGSGAWRATRLCSAAS